MSSPESLDLFFLYKYLDRPLWSADNVAVNVANCVCKDAKDALVASLKSEDCNNEFRVVETSFTSEIVLDTAEDKAAKFKGKRLLNKPMRLIVAIKHYCLKLF